MFSSFGHMTSSSTLKHNMTVTKEGPGATVHPIRQAIFQITWAGASPFYENSVLWFRSTEPYALSKGAPGK